MGYVSFRYYSRLDDAYRQKERLKGKIMDEVVEPLRAQMMEVVSSPIRLTENDVELRFRESGECIFDAIAEVT